MQSIVWVYLCRLSFTGCLSGLMKSLEINTSLNTLGLHLRREEMNEYPARLTPSHPDTGATAKLQTYFD